MKTKTKKIFSAFLFPLFTILSLVGFSSCAILGLEETPQREYDRGYTAENTYGEKECDEEDCDLPKSHRRPTTEHGESAMESIQDRIQQAVSARDVVVGMSPRDVVSSWGSPQQRELAGSGEMGHERWTYGSSFSLSQPRVVYFENGKVAGWQ